MALQCSCPTFWHSSEREILKRPGRSVMPCDRSLCWREAIDEKRKGWLEAAPYLFAQLEAPASLTRRWKMEESAVVDLITKSRKALKQSFPVQKQRSRPRIKFASVPAPRS